MEELLLLYRVLYASPKTFNGPNVEGIDFGGVGWFVGPERETVLGVTSMERTCLTIDIALKVAGNAKET